MFDGFDVIRVEVGSDVRLRVRHGGSGAPVVLLHGHPRTHTTWHRVAPLLVALGNTVVCPDLRGYGQSSKPPSTADHAGYSKRAMADDIRNLMGRPGHDRFAVVGHDRGRYVALRLALDTPEVRVPPGHPGQRADRRGAAPCGCPVRQCVVALVLLRPTGQAGAGDSRRSGGVVWREPPEHGCGESCRLLAVWAPWTTELDGGRIDSGHHMAEEAPAELTRRLAEFLALR
ncbi:MAG: alpha/beta fold hydrolase [Jiangellaceae bacterium]